MGGLQKLFPSGWKWTWFLLCTHDLLHDIASTLCRLFQFEFPLLSCPKWWSAPATAELLLRRRIAATSTRSNLCWKPMGGWLRALPWTVGPGLFFFFLKALWRKLCELPVALQWQILGPLNMAGTQIQLKLSSSLVLFKIWMTKKWHLLEPRKEKHRYTQTLTHTLVFTSEGRRDQCLIICSPNAWNEIAALSHVVWNRHLVKLNLAASLPLVALVHYHNDPDRSCECAGAGTTKHSGGSQPLWLSVFLSSAKRRTIKVALLSPTVSFASTDIHADKRKPEKFINRNKRHICECKSKSAGSFVARSASMRNVAALVYSSSLTSIGIVDLLPRGTRAGLKV